MSSDPNRSKSRKGGKRKIGRSSRKPSHSRYNSEQRWEKNKTRKAAKVKRQMEKKAAKKLRNKDQ
jgi:hypothetical protein